jgi:microcystin-dependent protein
MDAYIGMIMLWPIARIPQDWRLCDGSQLAIQQYTALFSLINITYGGDGKTNFNLPDLRGIFPAGYGPTASAPFNKLGAKGGALSVTLKENQIAPHTHAVTLTDNGHVHSVSTPAHTHSFAMPCDSSAAAPTVASPVNAYLSNTQGIDANISQQGTAVSGTPLYSANHAGSMGSGTTGSASGAAADTTSVKTGIAMTVARNDGGAPVYTVPPFLALGYIICVIGIYPTFD